MTEVACITINTDASYAQYPPLGSYAFYIFVGSQRIKQAGLFKTPPENSLDAEMKSMCNALTALLKCPDLPKTKYLIINTDLKGIEKVLDSPRTKYASADILRDLIEKATVATQARYFEFRHVLAHTSNKDGRSIVNKWCDQEAGRIRKEEKRRLIAAGYVLPSQNEIDSLIHRNRERKKQGLPPVSALTVSFRKKMGPPVAGKSKTCTGCGKTNMGRCYSVNDEKGIGVRGAIHCETCHNNHKNNIKKSLHISTG